MTIHAMIQHDGTENAFLHELVLGGVQAPSLSRGTGS